jgi:hypothetical protein
VDDLTFEVGRGEVVGFLCAPSPGDGRCGRLLAGRRVPRVQRGRPAYVTGIRAVASGLRGPRRTLAPRARSTFCGSMAHTWGRSVPPPARRRWRRFH